MSAARHLRVIDGNGELVETTDPAETIKALEAALARQENIIKALRADKHRERKDYARRQVIEDAFTDWRDKLVRTGLKGKARCKLSNDRFDAMKAMAEAGYALEDFLAVNSGIAACQFVVYGKRRQHGSEDSHNVDIAWVCEKARRFEEAAKLGYMVRKAEAA